MNPAKAHHIAMLEKVSAFMNYRDIPSALQKRIRNYYRYMWEKRLGCDESEIISVLPATLQMEISLFLKKDIIEKVHLFQGASDDFIKEVALEMRPVVFMPGDYIYKIGEKARDMYFISRGTLEVTSKDDQEVYRTLTVGDFFGEIALIQNQHRTANVRALGYCDLYRLDKNMFDHILTHHPVIAEQIKAKAFERKTKF